MWSQISSLLETLPQRLGGHIFLALTALAVGILISIPLGIWATRRPKAEKFFLMLASIIQTIPSLALLALMVFVGGTIGWLPALIALILYSLLPMLRNTITGLHGIDANIIEAARGVGMNDRQTLLNVQLPLAAPTIVAGIRTASVWVVGAATIAQPVGATSLGNYIFVGLQTMNYVSLLFGCVFSALLALLLDWLLHGLERAANQRSLRMASTMALGLAILAVSPLLLARINFSGSQATSGMQVTAADDPQASFVVGSKAFTEQYILADLIGQRLSQLGLIADVRDGMGSATVFHALENGQIDCFVDYTGTIWANYMKRTDTTTPAEMLVDVATFLKSKGIICLGSLGFSNDYAFAMRRADAEQLSVIDLSDLAKVSRNLVAGTDIEFFDRPEWRAVRDAYGLEFSKRTTMDSTLMYGAIANRQLDVIIAFNTDSRITAYDLTVIEDPRFALPPYDAVLLVSTRMARSAKAMRALRPLIQSISSTEMRHANGMVDVDKQPVVHASGYLLRQMKSTRLP